MLKFNNFYYPDEATGTGVESTIELLNTEDEVKDEPLKLDEEVKEPEGEEKEGEEQEEEKEEDELKDFEEELEKEANEDDENFELIAPVRRKEILKDFPELFKKYPHIEHALYRYPKFTEIFPTLQDAKSAVEKAEVLDRFDNDVRNGDITKILEVASQTREGFNRLADDYLPALARVDKTAYNHVIGNVIKVVSNGLRERGAKIKDKDLGIAADILNEFIFGDKDPGEITQLAKPQEKDDREEKIKQREQEFLQKQYDNDREALATRVENTIKSTIAANIDPRNSMPEYNREKASEEALRNLSDILDKDVRLTKIVDKLWEQYLANPNKNTIEKIRSAYLSQAKTQLPGVIKQARNRALKGLGRKSVETENTENKSTNHTPVRAAAPQRSSKSDSQKAKEIPANMSSRDYLMQD